MKLMDPGANERELMVQFQNTGLVKIPAKEIRSVPQQLVCINPSLQDDVSMECWEVWQCEQSLVAERERGTDGGSGQDLCHPTRM